MNWLVLVAIATITDSLRIFIDNYSSDVYFKGKGSVSQKLVYGYFFIITAIIGTVIIGFNPFSIPIENLLFLLLGGALSSLSGITYFRALELDDSTNIGIFTQLAPVFYLILGWFFLGDTFSPIQLVAFVIILLAPFLIVFTTRKNSRKIRIRAAISAIIYVLIAVIGNIIFIKAEEASSLNFVQDLLILFFGKGITGVIVVYVNPKWHKRLKYVMKKSRKKVLRPLICNFIVSLFKEFSYRGALALAPAVAIASVTSDSAEPIVIFFMGIILTLIWPKFGREKLDRKTVLVHLIATALVVVGIVLMQM